MLKGWGFRFIQIWADPFWGLVRDKIRKILIYLQKSSHEPQAGMHYLAGSILWAMKFKFFKMKFRGLCMAPPQGLNFYITICKEMRKKMFFSRTAAPNGTIFSMDHP